MAMRYKTAKSTEDNDGVRASRAQLLSIKLYIMHTKSVTSHLTCNGSGNAITSPMPLQAGIPRRHAMHAAKEASMLLVSMQDDRQTASMLLMRMQHDWQTPM